jgi:NAD(P)-dependent dehydrogenase (short-subunit alcohol dehydrogenase family)
MPSAADARAYSVSYTPPGAAGPPVAVVLGGTAGIGAGIASELAAGLKGELDVFLLGRNAAAARAVLDAMPPGSGRKREFVRCDATLMADVARAAGEVRAQAEKVNYLVMSPGIMTLQGRTETAEGIDEKMALHYYARWKLAQECVPPFLARDLMY